MKNFFFIAAAAAVLVSCQSKEYPGWNSPLAEDETVYHDQIVLGEQLQDPYSVENMTKALANVHPAAAGRVALEPTDFYVRFLPANDEQLDCLTALGLELVDHPLDYRIVREGDWYHDPDVPEESITWLYTVVPVDFEFPRDIRYERLDDCYLVDHDLSTRAEGIDWEEVEREAYRLTGNDGMLLPVTKDGEESPAAAPEGRICFLDPDHSEEPEGVKGVKVVCNSFVKFATCYTNEDGFYRMSKSFSTKPRYRLVFQNIKGFSQGINFILVPASVSTFGKQPASGYSVTLDKFSERKLLIRCIVNNVGYDYTELSKETSGQIPAPPKDLRIWNFELFNLELATMMHHGVLVETMQQLADMPKEYGMLIKIIQPDMLVGYNGLESCADIYGKALHMFAHAGHFARTDKEWWWNYLQYAFKSFLSSTLTDIYGSEGETLSDYLEIAETYAFYCQNALMRRRYGEDRELDGTTYWFSPQLLLYLDERGLTLEQIAPLFTSDVTQMSELHEKMLSYYPSFKTIINEAFTRYNK